jgi:hypothetical protein
LSEKLQPILCDSISECWGRNQKRKKSKKMRTFSYVLAAVAAVAFTAGADAAPRKKQMERHDSYVQRQASPYGQVSPSRPLWAGPNQCFTDEGYGRYSPCDLSGRGF